MYYILQLGQEQERVKRFFFFLYQTFLIDFSLYAYLINPSIHSSADVRITTDLENMDYMEKINTFCFLAYI